MNNLSREQLTEIAKHGDIVIATDDTILKGENKLVTISATGIGQKLCIIRNVRREDFEQANNHHTTNN